MSINFTSGLHNCVDLNLGFDYLPCILFQPYMLKKNLKSISINDIHYTYRKRSNFRYEVADIDYPIILAENVKNNGNKKFRVVDGRHRLTKAMDLGWEKINSYVVSKDIFYKIANQYLND